MRWIIDIDYINNCKDIIPKYVGENVAWKICRKQNA